MLCYSEYFSLYSSRIDVILCNVILRETQTNTENVMMKKKKKKAMGKRLVFTESSWIIIRQVTITL